MNESTISYNVIFSNEDGIAVDHVFTPDERDEAIDMFHNLLELDFAGFPASDKDMDFQGYYDRDTAQYGYNESSYREGNGGNTTVTFAALIHDPMHYSVMDSDSETYSDVLNTFHEGLADKTVKANGTVAEIMRWNNGKVYAIQYSTGTATSPFGNYDVLVFNTWDLARKWQDAVTN